jgi:sporulation protein YlmC with PRC-barrel domain
MLVYNSRLIGTSVLSVQASGPIGRIISSIIDPDNLQIIAFRLEGPGVDRRQNILDTRSIREYSKYGMVIDTADELMADGEVVRISEVLGLNFNLIGLKVETKKGSNLGKVIDFTLTPDDFVTQQLIVKRPAIKSFIDPALTIPRQEIIEVTDYKIIVKNEEKVIKKLAAKEEFVPNFVNPFRNQDFAPMDSDKSMDSDK